MRILITGGCGFIGSALIRHLLPGSSHDVLNVDALTYAGTPGAVSAAAGDPRYRFLKADIRDAPTIRDTIATFKPEIIAHLAAESHVDRSIDDPAAFVTTNVVGTFTMLAEAHRYWLTLGPDARHRFRFHHISTDEVFGSLGPTGAFTEETRYDPRSPYSASKAGSDHLASAWWHTYGLPVLMTNCSNNYGPYQFPEKLIPLTIGRALSGQSLPIYGSGENVRDWLHVEDHSRALALVFERGTPGRRYNVGGNAERRNIDVVETICATLDRLSPRADGHPYREQIAFVADRPGHDARYAIDATRLRDELGWEPRESFDSGVDHTVRWYLDNRDWWEPLVAGGRAAERRGLGG